MSLISTTSSSFRWYYQPGTGVAEGFLNVAASVAGGPAHVFQLDTGSCGLVIGRGQVGAPFDQPDPSLKPGSIHYMPSGITLTGQWTTVPVTLLNPEGSPQQPAATTTVTALIVDEPADFTGGMLGVGYQGTDLLLNPLLQVVMDGGTGGGQALSAGYVLTPEWVEVGLTEQNQAGFGYAALQPSAKEPGAWMGPTAAVTLGGAPLFPQPVTLELPMLMDTGIRHMMLFADPAGLPAGWKNAGPSIQDQVHVPTGQVEIGVTLPAQGTPLVSYVFGNGRAALQAPQDVIYMGPGSGLNTGIHVLRVHDYLFDAANLRIGFRRRPPQ